MTLQHKTGLAPHSHIPAQPQAHSNASWQRRSLASVWHPCTQMKQLDAQPPLAIRAGRGAWLFDHDGHRFLDGISSWWVNLFGHANPYINQALKHQLDTLEHVMLAGCTHEPAVELAERLSRLTTGVLGHAFFASDGASAVEIALKMSAHSWRNQGRSAKTEFVCVRHGYHGETLGALGVTDIPLFQDAYGPLITRAHVIDSPDARQAQGARTAAEVARDAARSLEALLVERAPHIAAVVVEPLVQCAAGMAMHDALFVSELRRLCDQHQVHLIADEIAVGCGRTGSFFACEQAGIWPDFLCLSKGISGGYLPLSIVLSTPQIYRSFLDDDTARGFLHSHSYTGNPLACRAALATLDLFETHDVLHHNKARAARLTERLAPLAQHPRVRHFRQRGMIWAFDVDGADPLFARRFHQQALAQELLLRPIGNTVYLMPPYVLSDDEQDLIAERLPRVLERTLQDQPPARVAEPTLA
jgi:adenosylmethionine-8-amino-7-oxononanoate aminotransferase